MNLNIFKYFTIQGYGSGDTLRSGTIKNESGTSLILEADFGHKAFSGYVTATTIEVSGGGTGGGGRGRGRHETVTETETTTTKTVLNQVEGPKLNQMVLLARVAQSVFQKVGVYVQFRQQF